MPSSFSERRQTQCVLCFIAVFVLAENTIARLQSIYCLMQGVDAASAALTPAIRRIIGHEAATYRLAIFGILHGSDGQVSLL